MSDARTVRVDLAGRGYDVVIGTNLIARLPQYAGKRLRKATVPVVADANAWAHHGETLKEALGRADKEVALFSVEPGEGSKSWRNLEALTDWMLNLGVERGDQVIAFGGGVVGDLTGFASAILKRGCGFIQVPTTLLAQVDSSVGGKTAINAKSGKNLIGAFHQPSLVLADTGALATLPRREMQAGFAEVIKYGILGDAAFFDWCSANASAVISHDPVALNQAVAKSVEAKTRIVAADERELSGRRALLNLGHTFGHALEAETGFSDTLLHGEAVALGMVLAARYSARRGELSDEDAERVAAGIAVAGLRAEISALELKSDGPRLVEHMRHDKKMDAGTLPFLLLRAIGEAYVAHDVILSDVADFLDQQLRSRVSA
ncbi:MAG: 3-dehydroquinate synthase [Erythrobacter sp.]|uniref:3-dehydroquinate synthase n=1 Tax=Erythrobacter sp. TaxID=1042 RepID=UPI00261C891D|nr:3-dehydroquinate synthase [Erythrobacter sp.]MDJ0977367.1 3-dehydroquinate synthase [Erythrobacter sp.]